jgi:hypothetical protein
MERKIKTTVPDLLIKVTSESIQISLVNPEKDFL